MIYSHCAVADTLHKKNIYI